ncbi:ABC transporter ATP-binding protein [Geodermatophilus sp. SYSU D00742]
MSTHAAHRPPGSLRVAAPFIRPQAGLLALAAGAAVVEVATTLLGPWPLALAVDHALGERPLEGPAGILSGLDPVGLLVVAGAALVGLSVLGAVLDTVTRIWAERAAERMAGAMRSALFSRAITLSLRWHDRTRTGEITSRLTADVGRMLDAVVAVFTQLLPDLLLLVGALVLLFAVDPSLAWLGLVVLPVLVWVTSVQRRRVRAATLAAREASGRLSGAAIDLLRNVRAVQAFGRLDRAGQMFGEPNERAVAANTRAAIVDARWSPVAGILLSIGSGIVLVAGGLQVRNGTLTVGQLLVVLAYLRQLQSPVRSLVRLVTVQAKAHASAIRIDQVLSCTEAVPEPAEPRPVPPVREGIRLESVSFSYGPDRPVLRDFDLTLRAGETVCLFGPSGAGKSTVLSLLLRLYDPDAGRVLIDGVDIREMATVELRRQLAFVPQDPWLLDGTLAENIAFGNPDATRADVLAAGRAAWVDEFALSLPQGYDTQLGESGVMLSGGQRRRVALARAVVSTAPVVLLDEPTTSLDAEAARQVVGAIRSATRDRTVLLVTHDPVLAAIADRTVAVSPHRPPAPPAGVPAPGTGPSDDDGAPREAGAHRDDAAAGTSHSGGRRRGRALASTAHHEPVERR